MLNLALKCCLLLGRRGPEAIFSNILIALIKITRSSLNQVRSTSICRTYWIFKGFFSCTFYRTSSFEKHASSLESGLFWNFHGVRGPRTSSILMHLCEALQVGDDLAMGVLGSNSNGNVEIVRCWTRAVPMEMAKREWVRKSWRGQMNVVSWLTGCRKYGDDNKSSILSKYREGKIMNFMIQYKGEERSDLRKKIYSTWTCWVLKLLGHVTNN